MIVEATPEDIDELFPLWLELMHHHQSHHKVFRCKPNHEKPLKAELLNRIRERNTQVLVFEKQGEWVGMIICILRQGVNGFELNRKGYIAETVIKKAYRNQGIGKALFDAALKWLQDKGADHVELQVSVNNPDALRFWESQGFTPVTQHMVKVLK
ncbi:GNAT family N-acetyltransferase [Pontibacter sp. KCTC 32443]|uniref:GNAT family N-acetyltransferase n=1 Tax=Pontibacter TaxID=323449 RepID=UPI00164E01B7|nr:MULTISPECIES: GNAT family N-acetyltransferase [Pontibacter]MBC5772848.1 GNAT family N-acetyltransferase [Pontibacter sp. KCTC 32443]